MYNLTLASRIICFLIFLRKDYRADLFIKERRNWRTNRKIVCEPIKRQADLNQLRLNFLSFSCETLQFLSSCTSAEPFLCKDLEVCTPMHATFSGSLKDLLCLGVRVGLSKCVGSGLALMGGSRNGLCPPFAISVVTFWKRGTFCADPGFCFYHEPRSSWF